MMHGHPASGKSTAAQKIRDFFLRQGIAAEVISSAKFRLSSRKHGSSVGFVDENNNRSRKVKDKAYRNVCRMAGACLEKSTLPILDATFHKLRRRKWVYSLAAKERARVYVVWTVFRDAGSRALPSYLMKRKSSGKIVALHTYAQYEKMVSQTELLGEAELSLLKIIRFDWQSRRIKLYNCSRRDSFAMQLVKAITQ